MDILIKGMGLPKEKHIRVEIHHDGAMYVQENGYYSFYVKSQDKAIELPPHGRLGDLDALQKQIEDDIETVANEKGKVGLRELWQILNKNIENAPAVVEATE